MSMREIFGSAKDHGQEKFDYQPINLSIQDCAICRACSIFRLWRIASGQAVLCMVLKLTPQHECLMCSGAAGTEAKKRRWRNLVFLQDTF